MHFDSYNLYSISRNCSNWKWVRSGTAPLLLILFGLIAFSVIAILLENSYKPLERSTGEALVDPDLDVQSQLRLNYTFKFEVCNGFANQRLGLLHGLLLALYLNRTALLPNLLVVGTQGSLESVLPSTQNSVAFGDLYHTRTLQATLARYGVAIASNLPEGSTVVNVELKSGNSSHLQLAEYNSAPHVEVGCLLLDLSPALVVQYEEFAKDILQSLKLVDPWSATVNTGVSLLQKQSTTKRFNFLHLRIESDWLEHCRRWEGNEDGFWRRNCLNNSFVVHTQLLDKQVSPDVPLYVASHWPDVRPQLSQLVKARLEHAGYQVFTRQDVFNTEMMGRDVEAAIDFYIAMQAEKFMGNSVSTFSAMLILERRLQNLWASYYNGGNIPLEQFLPLYPLPWVFTFNSWSPDYEYLLQAAVLSALDVGSMKPFCLYMGSRTAPILSWLITNNVTVLFHEPSWWQTLINIGFTGWRNGMTNTPLFKSPEALISTFQRFDIPLIPELRQYTYVLYTDADVFFHRRLTMADFPLPLPKSIAMAMEFIGKGSLPVGNAGVMLMHMHYLRSTHDKFISFVLSNQDGLKFGKYGPADQGAYNQFFKADNVAGQLSQIFNARPFYQFDEEPFIVHFHGPKPPDYVNYFFTGECKFGEDRMDLCMAGMDQMCLLADEWGQYLDTHRLAISLLHVCTVLKKVDLSDDEFYNDFSDADDDSTAVEGGVASRPYTTLSEGRNANSGGGFSDSLAEIFGPTVEISEGPFEGLEEAGGEGAAEQAEPSGTPANNVGDKAGASGDDVSPAQGGDDVWAWDNNDSQAQAGVDDRQLQAGG